jgi:hypothetical protein
MDLFQFLILSGENSDGRSVGIVRSRTKAAEFILFNPFGRTRPVEVTQPLTQMTISSRKIIFLGSRALPVRRADKLTAICEPIV